jgi:hypothetical protein
MIENLMLDVFIFVIVIVALACVFVPFFLDANDKINAHYEEEDKMK